VDIPGNTPENFGKKVDDTEAQALCIALSATTSVNSVDLSYNNIGNAGAIALAELLRNNNTIQSLSLSYNNIGPLGARALADSLLLSMSLQSMSLQGNDLDDEGGVALAVMLRGNNCLTALDLSRTGISTRSLVSILQAIASHPTLAALSLDRPLLPGVHDVTCVVNHLSLALQRNATLRHLSLGYFGLEDDHIATLLPHLVANMSLQSILLRGNRLSSTGGLHVAKLLARRHDIVEVDLEGNHIDNDGAASISAAVRHSTTLHTLLLASNNIGEKGLIAVADCIPLCPSLMNITLWGNRWSPQAAARFAQLPRSRLAMMAIDITTQTVDGVTNCVRL